MTGGAGRSFDQRGSTDVGEDSLASIPLWIHGLGGWRQGPEMQMRLHSPGQTLGVGRCLSSPRV